MMFSVVLSIFILFIPQIVHSPIDFGFSEPPKTVVEENFNAQVEGDVPVGGLERSAPIAPQKKDDSKSLGIETSARSAIVFDEGTGTVLFAKNSQDKESLASLTKLMTALVFLDKKIDWNKKIIMTRADDREGGIVYARSPDQVTVKDLFNMMLVGSVNNAAVALARATGETEQEFVSEMNAKAKEMGLENINFADPTGLLPENQGTAREVAKLLAAAMSREEINSVVTQKIYVFSPQNSKKVYYVKSTDELLWSFLNGDPYHFIGGKTGYITEAGYNLAVEVERDGHKVVAVVLGSDNAEDRFVEVKGLIDWVFENYNW